MRKILFSLSLVAISCLTMNAQQHKHNRVRHLQNKVNSLEKKVEKLSRFKFGGYIQATADFGQEYSTLTIGKVQSKEKQAIGLRRGFIKLAYEYKLAKALVLLNITERGVGPVESYFQLASPWKNISPSSLRMGLFIRPFGHELPYSSSLRESPERSMIIDKLFPEYSDVGAMLTLQARKTSPWHFLKFQTALIAGNGIGSETDARKDIVSHLSMKKRLSQNLHLGLGFSHYYGHRKNGNNMIYKMNDGAFKAEKTTDEYSLRQYFGFDAQMKLKTSLGFTQLRGEYIFGSQPALANSSRGPVDAPKPINDTYIRNCRGGYLIFVQDLGKLPLSAVLKYDFYDPNTKVSGNEISMANNLEQADVMQSAYGLGLLWHINKALRFQAYYKINKNEISNNLDGFKSDRADNRLTFRLQYKF